MANWVLKGLRTGIKSSAYPGARDDAPGISPGRPAGTRLNSTAAAEQLVARCPTAAIARDENGIAIDHRRCIHCFRCRRDVEEAATWQQDFEWAANAGEPALRKFAKCVRPLAARSLCRRRRLRRLHERGASNQQSLLQHAPLGHFHHADAAQRRCSARCGADFGCDAVAVAQDLRGDADAETGRRHRGLRRVRRHFRPELRRGGGRRRDHSGRCHRAGMPAAAFGDSARIAFGGGEKAAVGADLVAPQQRRSAHEHDRAAFSRILHPMCRRSRPRIPGARSGRCRCCLRPSARSPP